MRAATVPDLSLIESLAREIWPRVYREMISADQIAYMLDWMYAEDRLRRDLGEGIHYDLIEDGGKTVGFAGYGPLEIGMDCFLHKLYVHPEHQGKGLGSLALAHVEARARARGGARLTLRVNRNNHGALRLYERQGFQRLEEVCSDIGGGFVMDDYVMAKPLEPERET